MPDYDDNMTFVLFRNDRKKKESDPDYTGSAEVDHKEYYASAWINETRDGRKYMKGRLREKEERPSSEPDPKPKYDDDDIPF